MADDVGEGRWVSIGLRVGVNDETLSQMPGPAITAATASCFAGSRPGWSSMINRSQSGRSEPAFMAA